MHAKQTRALILVAVANECFLSSALANVVLDEQARLGKDCSFTVVATAIENEVHSRASQTKDSESLAFQLASQSSSWSQRISTVTKIFGPN